MSPGDVLGAEKGPGEVDADLTVPALERHLEHAQAAEDSCVVDENVGTTMGPTDTRHHRLHLCFVGDVADDAESLAPAARDPVRALLRVLR